MTTLLDEHGRPLAPVSSMDTGQLTWSQAVPRLIQVAAHAPQPEAREFALGQLMLLAEIVDRHIAQLQALQDAIDNRADNPIVCPDCGVRSQDGKAHAFGCPLSPGQDNQA